MISKIRVEVSAIMVDLKIVIDILYDANTHRSWCVQLDIHTSLAHKSSGMTVVNHDECAIFVRWR